MRDKYLFEKNANVVSPGAKLRQADLDKLFAANKGSRKLLSGNAYQRMKTELGGAAGNESKIHESLHAYERDFLDIGNWPRFRGALRMRYPSLKIVEAPAEAKVTLRGDFGQGEETVGWIHLDHARFVRHDPPRPDLAAHDVYVRRDDPTRRHYIMLPDTDPPMFVRRYVVRGLNGHNAKDLQDNKPMRAAHYTKKAEAMPNPQPTELKHDTNYPARHPKTTKQALTESEQLLSHTRGWKKRYISAGVGNHAPLSTRGEAFRTLFGMVAIDLGRIADLATVFDIHNPRGAKQYMDLTPGPSLKRREGAPHTGVGAGTYEGERYLALRDVLRTRELVIKRDVPVNAVVKQKEAARIVAAACPSTEVQAEVMVLLRGQPGFENEEVESFAWMDGKRWCFALFDSEPHATSAKNAVVSAKLKASVECLSTFSFVRPAGMPDAA